LDTLVNQLDSEAMGATVVDIVDFSNTVAFADFEQALIRQHQPRYVACKVPLEDLSAIHTLEAHGFRMIETQFRSMLRLRDCVDTSQWPYRYELVQDQADLEQVLAIAETTFEADRYTIDSDIPAVVAGRRYSAYVQRSFTADDECVHKLVNPDSGEIVGFNTYRRQSPREAMLLLAGVVPRYKSTGLGKLLNDYVLNDLFAEGVGRVHTHQSARNYAILNLEIGYNGFRVVQAYAVLRKTYTG